MNKKQIITEHYKKIGSLGGKKRAKVLTKEQLTEIGRNGAKIKRQKRAINNTSAVHSFGINQ